MYSYFALKFVDLSFSGKRFIAIFFYRLLNSEICLAKRRIVIFVRQINILNQTEQNFF